MKRNGAVLMMAAVLLLAVIVGGIVGIRDGGREVDLFNPANFAQRQALPLAADTPHGKTSVHYIEVINDTLYDRAPFSYREMYAAQWIVEELLAMGFAWDEIRVQEFVYEDVREFWDLPLMDIIFGVDQSPFLDWGTRNSRLSQNVILTLPGQSDKKMVVGAHYDSVFYPGASDNASGVALLLESAWRMRDIDHYYTIVYIFFGAEEAGLYGAYYYAHALTQEEHDNILFMINADVLLEGPDLFYMAGYDAGDTPGANHITETWDEIARNMDVWHGITLTPLPDGVFGPSDQLAFLPWGHTAMFLVGFDAVAGWYDTGAPIMTLLEAARVVHTPMDDFHFIEETWPGKIEANMRGFSLFLEELLLAKYYVD
ncbi:MAG: M28 family metallopeptidase [Oscillospiraceae bacterium]|nr:M28 family metallopeptidase [Oscillospiraceae bacterium]